MSNCFNYRVLLSLKWTCCKARTNLCDQGKVSPPRLSLPADSVLYSSGRDRISHLTSSLPLDLSKVHSLSSLYSKPNGPVAVYTKPPPPPPTATSVNKSNRGQRASFWQPFTVYFILFQLFSALHPSVIVCQCVYYNTDSLYT